MSLRVLSSGVLMLAALCRGAVTPLTAEVFMGFAVPIERPVTAQARSAALAVPAAAPALVYPAGKFLMFGFSDPDTNVVAVQIWAAVDNFTDLNSYTPLETIPYTPPNPKYVVVEETNTSGFFILLAIDGNGNHSAWATNTVKGPIVRQIQ